jgi:hypothetical protein
MHMVLRLNRQADHFQALAAAHDGNLGDSYLALAAAYRAMAQSVVVELWWPRHPPRPAACLKRGD